MGDFPRARFLPKKPLMILPRSSRQRRENASLRASWLRKWGEAFVITGIVLLIVAVVVFFMFCIGTFEHR